MRKRISQGTAKKALAVLTAAVLMGTGIGMMPAPEAEAAAAKAKKLKFKSLSKKVSKVSSKGKVTAKKKGTAKIKVTTVAKNKKGRKLTKTIKIKVKKYVAPTGIKASISASTLQAGKTAQITALLSR